MSFISSNSEGRTNLQMYLAIPLRHTHPAHGVLQEESRNGDIVKLTIARDANEPRDRERSVHSSLRANIGNSVRNDWSAHWHTRHHGGHHLGHRLHNNRLLGGYITLSCNWSLDRERPRVKGRDRYPKGRTSSFENETNVVPVLIGE